MPVVHDQRRKIIDSNPILLEPSRVLRKPQRVLYPQLHVSSRRDVLVRLHEPRQFYVRDCLVVVRLFIHLFDRLFRRRLNFFPFVEFDPADRLRDVFLQFLRVQLPVVIEIDFREERSQRVHVPRLCPA